MSSCQLKWISFTIHEPKMKILIETMNNSMSSFHLYSICKWFYFKTWKGNECFCTKFHLYKYGFLLSRNRALLLPRKQIEISGRPSARGFGWLRGIKDRQGSREHRKPTAYSRGKQSNGLPLQHKGAHKHTHTYPHSKREIDLALPSIYKTFSIEASLERERERENFLWEFW